MLTASKEQAASRLGLELHQIEPDLMDIPRLSMGVSGGGGDSGGAVSAAKGDGAAKRLASCFGPGSLGPLDAFDAESP